MLEVTLMPQNAQKPYKSQYLGIPPSASGVIFRDIGSKKDRKEQS